MSIRKEKHFLQAEKFNPNLVTGAYSTPYYSSAGSLSCILDCLPSGNPILLTQSLQSEVFIDHITSDIYAHDQVNKLFITIGCIGSGYSSMMCLKCTHYSGIVSVWLNV